MRRYIIERFVSGTWYAVTCPKHHHEIDIIMESFHRTGGTFRVLDLMSGVDQGEHSKMTKRETYIEMLETAGWHVVKTGGPWRKSTVIYEKPGRVFHVWTVVHGLTHADLCWRPWPVAMRLEHERTAGTLLPCR